MRPEPQPREEPRSDYLGGLLAGPRDRDRRPDGERVLPLRSGGLTDQLHLSITEIAVMWMLHCRKPPARAVYSLTLDVIKFYPVALNALLGVESLRGASQSDLRLIYFKGLIVAGTHQKALMVDAVRRADRVLEGGVISDEKSGAATRLSTESQPVEEHETLAHIADALGHPRSVSH